MENHNAIPLRDDLRVANRLFQAGALIFFLMGMGHGLSSVVDVFIPFLFSPVDPAVKALMIDARILLTPKMSLWDAWLGFNICHGLGMAIFSLFLIVQARYDFSYFIKVKLLFLVILALAVGYFILCIKFWFYLPAICCVLVFSFFFASFLLVRKEWRKGAIVF